MVLLDMSHVPAIFSNRQRWLLGVTSLGAVCYGGIRFAEGWNRRSEIESLMHRLMDYFGQVPEATNPHTLMGSGAALIAGGVVGVILAGQDGLRAYRD